MPQKRLYFAADEKLLAALGEPLRRGGFVLETFEQQAALVAAVEEETPDVVLLGSRLTDGTALGAFRALGETAPPTMVILNRGQQAFRAGLLKAGVSDVAVAPVRPRVVAGRLMELAGGRRRNELRELTEVPVEIDVGTRHVHGTMRDVSREGIGVKVDGPLPDGIALQVLVKPPSGAALKIYGRLVHSRTDGDTVHAGLRFVGVTEDEESVLQQIAKAYPSSDIPLVIEKRLPRSEALAATTSADGVTPIIPLQPPVFAVATVEGEERVEWPAGMPSLLQTLEHLRYGVDWHAAKEAGLHEDVPPSRSEIEEAALRFAQGLSALEKQAFAPDPDILVILDDEPVQPSTSGSPSLEASFATMLCVGAARRFLALLMERRGRALLGQASIRRGLTPITVHDAVVEEVLTGLRQWTVDLQGSLYDAQLAREKDRARVLQTLQDLAAKQALALAEVLGTARSLVSQTAETGSNDALSRVS